VFTDVPGAEDPEGGSRFNTLEVTAVERVLLDFPEARIPPDIGVIAPHMVQVKAIRVLFPRRGFEVSTLDSYQGREKDVIVFSATYTRDTRFLDDVNRINVAPYLERRKQLQR
jgi:superfamily I DNA and/or RNA helicase